MDSILHVPPIPYGSFRKCICSVPSQIRCFNYNNTNGLPQWLFVETTRVNIILALYVTSLAQGPAKSAVKIKYKILSSHKEKIV